MKKFLAIVFVAACMTACNSNADGGTSDSTTVSADSGMTAPGGVDSSTLRTDTTGPRPDSGMGK